VHRFGRANPEPSPARSLAGPSPPELTFDRCLGCAAAGSVGSGSECAPKWLWFTFAVGLFVYQSLDAIDGKQARRTGTSGPLGELFDHGCDALNTTLEVILSAAAMNLGLSWWTSEYEQAGGLCGVG